MLRTDDIEGARPNKFKHSKRGYQISLMSPYNQIHQPVQLVKTIPTRLPYESHDLCHLPKVATKITGTDGSVPYHHPQYQPNRLDYQPQTHYHQKTFERQTKSLQSSPKLRPGLKVPYADEDLAEIAKIRNPMYADYNYAKYSPRIPSQTEIKVNHHQSYSQQVQQEGDVSTGIPQNILDSVTKAFGNLEEPVPKKQEPPAIQTDYVIEQPPNRGYLPVYTKNNYQEYPIQPRVEQYHPRQAIPQNPIYIQENTQNNQNRGRNLTLQTEQNSLIKTQPNESRKTNQTPPLRSGSETHLKKSLHHFYGMTPPPVSRNGEYYKSLQYQRYENPNPFKESFYQAGTQQTLEKAKNDNYFYRAMKQFYDVPLNQQEKFEKNRDQFYRGYTPVGQPQKFRNVDLRNSVDVNQNPLFVHQRQEINPINHRRVINPGFGSIHFRQSSTNLMQQDPRFRANAVRFFA